MNDGPPAARPPEAGFSAPEGFRAGFACVVGRPNTGKSTLTNAMVGRKVAIASARPETTRRVIRAVVNREDGQVVIVDTPGLHRPRTLLGERLNDMVRDSLAGVDAVVVDEAPERGLGADPGLAPAPPASGQPPHPGGPPRLASSDKRACDQSAGKGGRRVAFVHEITEGYS